MVSLHCKNKRLKYKLGYINLYKVTKDIVIEIKKKNKLDYKI